MLGQCGKLALTGIYLPSESWTNNKTPLAMRAIEERRWYLKLEPEGCGEGLKGARGCLDGGGEGGTGKLPRSPMLLYGFCKGKRFLPTTGSLLQATDANQGRPWGCIFGCGGGGPRAGPPSPWPPSRSPTPPPPRPPPSPPPPSATPSPPSAFPSWPSRLRTAPHRRTAARTRSLSGLGRLGRSVNSTSTFPPRSFGIASPARPNPPLCALAQNLRSPALN